MVSKNPVVDSKNLKRGEVWGETDAAVHWAGAFAFFAAAMFTQDFDQVMLPPKSHILGTRNREA
jgi:hypothetical protein